MLLSGRSVREEMLRQFVQDDPSLKPMVCDLPTKNHLFTVRSSLKQIEYRIGDFKSNYIKQYTEPMVRTTECMSLFR